MTEIKEFASPRGWVGFDAECGFCSRLARRFAPWLSRHRLTLVPLQTPWVMERLAKAGEEPLSELRLFTSQGGIYGGADALLGIARRSWWARPLCWLACVPGVRPALRAAYRHVAKNRSCVENRCRMEARSVVVEPAGLGRKWVPAVMPGVLALTLGRYLPEWIWMWVIAASLFLGAKWLTLSQLRVAREKVSRRRLLAYLLLWPGMDARAFCRNGLAPTPPAGECLLAGIKTALGGVLVWGVAPLVGPTRPLLTGWLGMLGLALLLHFGCFHLLSLAWRALGVNARPIMQSPAASTSLRQFWGRDWNAAFADLMRTHGFRPLARRFGAAGASFAVFVVSGLLHELVISVPAHGGFGLPTLYFILQALGVYLERSRPGRALGLGAGWKGWCLVALVAGLPVVGLFPPVFIRHVTLPMLRALGAI